jgi:uncharacterized protein (TIGR03435 family)
MPYKAATRLLVLAWALGSAQAADDLTFEVASVKVSPPVLSNERVYFGPPRGGPGTPDPTQITWSYATLRNLLMTAYDVKAYQLSGPEWLATQRYDIIAKVPAGTTKEQVMIMWQNLLTQRFGVALHRESREFNVEEMVIAKSGSKLKDTAEDLLVPSLPGPPELKDGTLVSPGLVTMMYPGAVRKARSIARAQPMTKLTEMLGNYLDRPVVDKTGLTGRYDFTLDYTLSGLPPSPGQAAPAPGTPADGASDPGPDLIAAVQQQLGLRLVRSRATLAVLVIDKAEKIPVAN